LSNKNQIKLTSSPCVSRCCLDESDICLGCYRHIDEIMGWRNYSNTEKEKIVTQCQQRRNNNATQGNN